MCGEMAGDEIAIPLLLGLGLDEFSMSASAIPYVKEMVRGMTMKDARAIAERVMDCSTSAEIKQIVKEELAKL
jgi:phosphotransferase system enzyme I (PtsI)